MKTFLLSITALLAVEAGGTPLGDALVKEARKGPHCSSAQVAKLVSQGARVPVQDWMVWYPEIIGCGDIAQKAYLSTPSDKREAMAMLGMSGILEQFQKHRSALRDAIAARKKTSQIPRTSRRIARIFHFLRVEMARRCGRGSRVACDIHLRARAFQSSLRNHLKTAPQSTEVRSLPRRNQKRWLKALRETATPFF